MKTLEKLLLGNRLATVKTNSGPMTRAYVQTPRSRAFPRILKPGVRKSQAADFPLNDGNRF